MAVGSTTEVPTGLESRAHELSREDLIRAFRLMYTSRRLDDREILLKRQNRIFFQISGAGHEAVQVAAGYALRSGQDWFYPYYRDRALCLALGVTPEEMLLAAVGAAADPSSGGRQMPSHWGHRKYHIVSSSSPTGTQFLQAVGCAQAGRYLDASSTEITLVTSGDGATSEGEFWEALNAACLDRLPDDLSGRGQRLRHLRARRAPNRRRQHFAAAGRFPQPPDSRSGRHGFSRLLPRALPRPSNTCRAGDGPALVHAHVIRPYSHSLSDDERLYKTEAERAAEAERDPIARFSEDLLRTGVLDRAALQRVAQEIDGQIQAVAEKVLDAPPPPRGSALRHLYSGKIDPTSDAFHIAPDFNGEPRTMVDEINLTLARGDAPQPEHRGLRRGRGRLQPRGKPWTT